MKIVTAIIATFFACSVVAGGIEQLKQNASQQDPHAQYELALHYLNGSDVEPSLQQAKYWFDLAAENGNQEAQKELVKLLLNTPDDEDVEQALYWLTLLAVNGASQDQMKLAKTYEKYSSRLANDTNAIIWYRIATPGSPQAEQKYSELLEARFNQRRLKQVAQIDQLNSAFEQPQSKATSALQGTPLISEGIITSDRVTIVAVVALISALLVWSATRQRRRWRRSKEQQYTISELHKKLQNQIRSEARLRQQMTTLLKQYKKLQAEQTTSPKPANGQKLVTACTLFGCDPHTIPAEAVLKQRYRQLSKVYHPDAGGSSAAMVQLNQSIKLLIATSKAQSK